MILGIVLNKAKLKKMKIKSEIIKVTEDLIRLKTDPDKHTELSKALDYVRTILKDFTIEEFESNGSNSILVYNTQFRPEKFDLLINCHLDVIPGKEYQYHPRVEGDKLYGVGAMDMKGNLAAAMLAFKDTSIGVDKSIAIQFVTDEEIGGFDGTKYQIQQGVNANFVIATEPTNFDIVNEAKGILQLEIKHLGETAHGAYTWQGINSVVKLNQLINKILEKYPLPNEAHGKTTVNVASFNCSNNSFNKVPDLASIKLDIRFEPNEYDNILSEFLALIGADFEVITHAFEPPLQVSSSNTYLQLLKTVTEDQLGKEIRFYRANGSSDSRHFTTINTPGVEFGPIGKGIGCDNEWVSISSLVDYYKIISEFITKI